MEEEQILLNEFKKWFKKKGLFGMKDMWFSCAKYFYELGCTRTAEKYDEIEYNRQRAEELEKPMQDELEKEIQGKRKALMEVFGPMNGEQVLAIKNIARHFAQWGAEHLKK